MSDTLMNSTLSVQDQRVLARISQHPLSHNLAWREVLALFTAIGSVGHSHNGDVVVTVGTAHQVFAPARDKDLTGDEVMALRHLLARAGWAQGTGAPSLADDLVVVIDHAGARVYRGATETHHLHHETRAKERDDDRDETWPEDRRFFDAVAGALPGEGRIVVIGHGKGQSNEADHLMADLAAHHSAVHARVAREIVADLPHMTEPQLLALARHALEAVSLPPS